jgi:hypothetical protein
MIMIDDDICIASMKLCESCLVVKRGGATLTFANGKKKYYCKACATSLLHREHKEMDKVNTESVDQSDNVKTVDDEEKSVDVDKNDDVHRKSNADDAVDKTIEDDDAVNVDDDVDDDDDADENVDDEKKDVKKDDENDQNENVDNDDVDDEVEDDDEDDEIVKATRRDKTCAQCQQVRRGGASITVKTILQYQHSRALNETKIVVVVVVVVCQRNN